ncbi:MAG: efflux RND transporter periplasmic adaptor subunit [Myxococcaceae bacterium]|nr:efflux RND transporter periplasmic adaptor subunit [Myxococcaceae bacterium]MBH2006748.1 efflux RND transporter periplasmic adaptor subunit [Myxococcaceae bacterium]
MKALCFLLFGLAAQAELPPKKIELFRVSSAPFVQTIALIGTLKAKQEVVLISKASGILSPVTPEGSQVKKGALLARLDQDSSLRKSLQDASTQLKNQKNKLERAQKLYHQGDFSLKDLESAQNDFASTRKSYRELEFRLSDSELRAPFNGTCGLFRAEAGSYVSAGSAIVTVYDAQSFTLYFSVPESLLPSMRIGLPVSVQGNSGRITSFENRLNPQTQVAYAKAELDSCTGCTIGTKVSVSIALPNKTHSISAPLESVFLKGGTSYVYRVVHQKALLTPVKTGERSKNRIEILSGLKMGDEIVLRGTRRLNHDDSVY